MINLRAGIFFLIFESGLCESVFFSAYGSGDYLGDFQGLILKESISVRNCIAAD